MQTKRFLVTMTVAGSLILMACTHQNEVIAPTPTNQGTSSPTPAITSPSPTVSPTIPTDWEVSSSETLLVSMAHPPDWYVSQAGSPTGEFAVTSFNPDSTPDAGGVPQDEIKVAIIRIAEDEPRSAEDVIDSEQVVRTEEVRVGGQPATLHEIQGELGGSLTTQVQTNQGTYFISAYPPDSELIDIYRQILDTISFE